MSDYSKLKEVAQAATAGPWVAGGNWVTTSKGNSIADCSRGDEKFIAAANPSVVLGLIAENERLKAWGKANGELAQTAMDKVLLANHEREQIKAENDALRSGLGEAKYRIEQGRVWNGMSWTLTGLNAHIQQKALDVIDLALKAEVKP